jgi:hypothetical protein
VWYSPRRHTAESGNGHKSEEKDLITTNELLKVLVGTENRKSTAAPDYSGISLQRRRLYMLNMHWK